MYVLFLVESLFLFTLVISANTIVGSVTSDAGEEVCLPHSARVDCSFLPLEFLDCDDLINHHGNKSNYDEKGYGCLKMGGQNYEDVEIGKAKCRVLEGIECCGKREFLKRGFPCIKYNQHYFVTTLIYSLLLGFLGMDRFCLGHSGTAVGKLLTLGGLGVWWLVDIVLLVTGALMPKDGTNWSPNV